MSDRPATCLVRLNKIKLYGVHIWAEVAEPQDAREPSVDYQRRNIEEALTYLLTKHTMPFMDDATAKAEASR